MNNLEWLYENDRDALADFAECDECETCKALDYCHGEHHDREWLMAEHVDDPHEVDAVAILRKYANFWSLSHETYTQCDSDWEKTTMRALADMIERDYVRREVHDEAIRLKLIDIGVQRARANELESERDEWKAKAEQAQESYFDAKSDRDAWHARYVTLQEGQSKVRAGSSKSAKRAAAVERLREGKSDNLEWMILGDDCPSWVNYDTLTYNKVLRERIADLLEDGTTELTVYNEASDDELFRCSYCHCKVYNIDMTEGDCGWGFTFCPQCGGEVYESDARKIEAELGEQWHDAFIDLLTDDDAHSKAHSKTEPLLTEQPESLSDEADSREKLENDIWAGCDHLTMLERGHMLVNVPYDKLLGWLDRQTAITRAECMCGFDGFLEARVLERTAELQAKVDELTAQLRESNAERERLRGCLGIAADHAHDFLALVDESGNVYDRDEGLA